jgi:hypothetical protein
MRPGDQKIFDALNAKLDSYNKIRRIPGVRAKATRSCFITQVIDSIRRIKYVTTIRDIEHDQTCTDPSSVSFDPIKAAAWHNQNGNNDESFWLIFLAIHFGKNLKTKWQLVSDIYGGLGTRTWNWQRVSTDIDAFRTWLDANEVTIKGNGGKFGNHRKYESLNAYRPSGTGNAIASYVEWIGPRHDHTAKIAEIIANCETEKESFATLYNSMARVKRFGRMGRFDFLTMIGKMGLANISPDSAYMNGATGPVTGARLFFGKKASAADLNEWLVELDEHLDLYFGMQVLEDALCNWQKNPTTYRHFSG